MCVVGFYHLYLNSIKRGATTIQEHNVRKFADLICHKLSGTNHNPCYTFLRHIIENNRIFIEHLVRTQDKNGQKNRYPADKQKITTKPVVIPSQITALYAEIIYIEIEIPSTKKHSGGASYVNCHCVQLVV